MSRMTICASSVGVDADDAIAGRLRLGADDAELLADDAVEERGFAGVGFADDGDDSGARHWTKVRMSGVRREEATNAPSSKSIGGFAMRCRRRPTLPRSRDGVPSAL